MNINATFISNPQSPHSYLFIYPGSIKRKTPAPPVPAIYSVRVCPCPSVSVRVRPCSSSYPPPTFACYSRDSESIFLLLVPRAWCLLPHVIPAKAGIQHKTASAEGGFLSFCLRCHFCLYVIPAKPGHEAKPRAAIANPSSALQGQNRPAQGNALGIMSPISSSSPVRAK